MDICNDKFCDIYCVIRYSAGKQTNNLAAIYCEYI